MATYRIEWLTDYFDCETCGGNCAEGARVSCDGDTVLEMLPVAHCFGGESYDPVDVYKALLEHVGHFVEDVEAA